MKSAFTLKHLLSTLLFLTLSAGSPSDSYGQRSDVMLKKIMWEQTNRNQRKNIRALGEPVEDDTLKITHYPVIIEIEDPDEAARVLDSLEAVVYHCRGPLYLTSIPVGHIEALPRFGGINAFHIGGGGSSNLDVARAVSNVDAVHRQLDILDGVGDPARHNVVTGMCDIGFDPRHEAFESSLKQWVIYDEYRGERTVFTGYDDIVANAPETDTYESTHATHVGNIIAGYSPGVAYYGVAPATDFVATVSRLTEVGICSGIEDVIEYAKAAGKPAVVNISAGSYLGPHDGKDLVGRYLSAMSDDAVICFSAGNYGQRNNCLSYDLDLLDTPRGSAWCDTGTWTGLDVYGGTDIWSRDDRPFEFRLVVWDTEKKEYALTTPWMGSEQPDGEFTLDLGDTDWFTSGAVWTAWGVHPENGRFNAVFEYDYTTDITVTGQTWARYAVAFHVRKSVGDTHVDIYSDGITSFLHSMGGPYCEFGNSDGSISNLSCCPDVASVGAWNSRSVVPDIESGTRDWGFETNRVPAWSAYGTSGDGRALPHFCAPGNTLVSAMSGPHGRSDNVIEDARHTAFNHNGNKYFATAGTSMSSPVTAGIFALWLSVNPTLTVHRLVDIAAKTADRNFVDIADPRWGAGAIDAFAGLREVLKQLGTDDIGLDAETTPKVFRKGDAIEVIWPGVPNPLVEAYDLTGRKLTLQNSALPTLHSTLCTGEKLCTLHSALCTERDSALCTLHFALSPHSALSPLLIIVTDPSTGARHTFKLL